MLIRHEPVPDNVRMPHQAFEDPPWVTRLPRSTTTLASVTDRVPAAVAARVGYPRLCNFTTAVERRFGRAPSKVAYCVNPQRTRGAVCGVAAGGADRIAHPTSRYRRGRVVRVSRQKQHQVNFFHRSNRLR